MAGERWWFSGVSEEVNLGEQVSGGDAAVVGQWWRHNDGWFLGQ